MITIDLVTVILTVLNTITVVIVTMTVWMLRLDRRTLRGRGLVDRIAISGVITYLRGEASRLRRS